ncbi:MAG: LysE family translocator [Proteobacteria bacterium]|nr:LysE family translocator [Pseudomonadota bacterium]
MIDPMPFATYSFVMSITPGPNNVMLTASGATFGFRKTIPHILGVLSGFSVVLFLVCAGLDAVFTRWPEIQAVLRWVGAAYLVYLGWRILRSGEAKDVESRKPLTALEAAGFQFLNPKAWMMTLTAAAMFLPRELGLMAASSYMVGVMAATNLPCITVWALFGSSMRGFLAKPRGRLTFNIVLSLALVVTGIAMVV